MKSPPPEPANVEVPEEADQSVPVDRPVSTGDFTRAYNLLRRLGNRWTFPIVGMLQHEPMRFAKLKRSLEPISQRMLTLSLRRLEQDNLVYRQELGSQPPQVTYGLTPLGIALVGRIKEFEVWLTARDLRPGPRR